MTSLKTSPNAIWLGVPRRALGRRREGVVDQSAVSEERGKQHD